MRQDKEPVSKVSHDLDETFKQIDDILQKDAQRQHEKTDEMSVDDKIKFGYNIRKNPPKPGYMKVEVQPSIYAIDLNTDAHWWFQRACTVIPLIVDQAVRTHVDIKDSFKPEKAKVEFPYLFLILAVGGILAAIILVMMFFFQ